MINGPIIEQNLRHYQGRGRLLDTNDVALVEPDRHTLHCLVDVGVCNVGPFFILQDPETEGGMYSVQYQLNDHTEMLAMARAAGRRGGGCSTCEGGSDGLVRGLRAEVIGVVTDVGDASTPPRIDMISAKVSNDLEAICSAFQGTNTNLLSPPHKFSLQMSGNPMLFRR